MLGLKPDEVAAVLNVSVETVRRQYREGKLKGYKVGNMIRIYPEQFKSMLGERYADFLNQLGAMNEALEPAPQIAPELDGIL